MESLLDKLYQVDSLPVLPETVRELQRVLSQDEGGADTLVLLIEQDVSLTSAVLTCANSALYNYSGRTITSLKEAIVRIGRNEIYSMLLTTALINMIPPENHAIDYRSFWVQSLATASLAKRLSSKSVIPSISNANMLYTAGLFHDLGILLYATCFIDHLQAVRKLQKENEWSFTMCEDHLSPSETHGQFGAVLLEIWKMDKEMVQLVRFHETPALAPAKAIYGASLIHICSRLVSHHLPDYELHNELEPGGEIFAMAGLNYEDFDTYREYASKAVEHAFDTLALWSQVTLRPLGSSRLFRPV